MATAIAPRVVDLVIDGDGEAVAVKFDGWEYPLGKSVPAGNRYFQADVPVNMIERDEEAQPRDYDPEQAKKIAKSIREKVLMQPILTRYDETLDRILVTEGQHRWRVFKDLLEAEKIPAIVYVDLNKYVALLCGLEANASDRARALSGGDIARKTHALMEEYAELLRKETSAEPSEVDVLNRIGITTKARQQQFLIGQIAEDVRAMPGSKIADFVSDRQGRSLPITMKNLMFFIAKLVKTTPVETVESLREQELANVLRITNIVAEELFDNEKWTPETPEQPDHQHALNLSRNRPFEILGYFVAKYVDGAGGGEASTGACYAEASGIAWDKVEQNVRRLLQSPVWDQPHIALSRSPDDIKQAVAAAMR
jgi:hypothetical protein